MIVLGDRNFAAAGLDHRGRRHRRRSAGPDQVQPRLPVCRRLPDGSYLSRIGAVEVRVIAAEITIATSAGQRSETYRLVTTVLDPRLTAAEIVRLYHERWEIETASSS